MAIPKAESVRLFWNSFSIHSALALRLACLSHPRQDSDVLRSLVSIAMFARGRTNS